MDRKQGWMLGRWQTHTHTPNRPDLVTNTTDVADGSGGSAIGWKLKSVLVRVYNRFFIFKPEPDTSYV